MKGKILDSDCCPETGWTYVVKNTKYGTFTAESYCAAEDMEYFNEWDGYRLCEYKCDLQALKEKIKWLRQRYIGMDQMLSHTPLSEATKDAYDLAWSLYCQIQKEQNLYDRLKDNYPIYAENLIKQRIDFRKQYCHDNQEQILESTKVLVGSFFI